MTYVIIFILAYCSIVYELTMAQSLSAFLGDTVLRYSTTIGLYLASMGIGAFLCRGGLFRNPAYSLVKIEIMLCFEFEGRIGNLKKGQKRPIGHAIKGMQC